MPLVERATEHKILIAVDFGTTFSSAVWKWTSETGETHVIQDWPNHGNTTDKVPTIIVYDSDNYSWGYEVDDQEPHYEWFKLDLDPSSQKAESNFARRYPATTRIPLGRLSRNAPRKLTTDYLTALRDHVECILKRSMFERVLRTTKREYIITVPAVWSDKAKELTAECAVDAGMGPRDRLHIVSEPEAAAIYAFSRFNEINAGSLKIGDTFVLCDAGGGTVDLISYTITGLDPILQLDEATPGSGDLCGSTFVNRVFAKTLNDKFEGDPSWDSDPEILEIAMGQFETRTKIRFNGQNGDNIKVAGVGPRPGVNRQRLELTGAEIGEIFNPIVIRILNLISEQIENTRKEVKLVLLVGGFSNNPYLQNKIKERFGADLVKVSPDCQTAVVRGALMKGLAEIRGGASRLPRIRARKVRKHYGTECVTPYKRRRRPEDDGHSPERKKANNFTGEYDVEIMKWFLTKGSLIEEDEAATFRFSTDQRADAGPPQKISLEVYCHPDPGNMGAPTYKIIDVAKLGTVTADIHDLDPRLLKKQRGSDGSIYYIMDFDIEMRCLAAQLEFTPVFIHDEGRKKFKPAVVSYD